MGNIIWVVTWDGGGVCGLFSIRVFQRIVARYPQLLSRIKVMGGTSTGGIIALALGRGVPVDQIVKMYRERSPEIFHRPFWNRIWSPFGLSRSLYDNTGLLKVVTDALGHCAMKDLQRETLVPAFDLRSDGTPDRPCWRTYYFDNMGQAPADAEESIIDVAMRTSAAPTFFPSYQGWIDGGMFANDPTMVTLAALVRHHPEIDIRKDVRVLSIGTGGQIKFIDGKNISWGAVGWVKPLVEIFMGSQAMVTNDMAESFMGDHYRRICPVIPDIAMDAADRVEDLIAAADATDLTEIFAWIEKNLGSTCPIS